MKRISIGLFITFLVLLVFSACQENIYVDWKLANEKWYNTHKSDSGFVTSETGLCYKIIYAGTNRPVQSTSYIRVNYTGSLIDNTVFASNNTLNGTWLTLSTTIAGWREIMPRLRTGAKVVIYVPSSLGYDTITTNTVIPPHSVLKFDINLLESVN